MYDTVSQYIIDAITTQYGSISTRDNTYLRIAQSIRDSLHPKQELVFRDPSRYKSVRCPRQSGKSWLVMSYAFWTCLRKSDAHVVICTLTMKQARNIYWAEMKMFAKRFGIEATWNSHELRVTLPNSSYIILIGADGTSEIEKLRGPKYDLVAIDECKSFAPRVLNELIDEVIQPAVSTRLGTILLAGTPGNILSGPFYEATQPTMMHGPENNKRYIAKTFEKPEPYWKKLTYPEQWSFHTWSRKDNLAEPHLWKDSLEMKRRKQWDDDNPIWLREHIGKWVKTQDSFVYAYATLIQSSPKRVTWTPEEKSEELFGLPDGDWNYILSLDLGFEDDYAIFVGAYNSTDQCFYHVYDFKENHKDVIEIAEKITEVYNMFGGNFTAMIADAGGLGKLVVETLNKRYGWNFQKADKKEKYDHIELLNADFRTGRVKVRKIPGEFCALDTELQSLQWNVDDGGKSVAELAKTSKLKELPGLPNHLCDALLYAWRFSYHFWARKADDVPSVGTPGWHNLQREQAINFLLKSRSDNGKPFKRELYGDFDVNLVDLWN